jgi:hypothetical protein
MVGYVKDKLDGAVLLLANHTMNQMRGIRVHGTGLPINPIHHFRGH